MKTKYYYLAVGLIIIFAALIRLFQFGQIPAGMTWDEAAIAYNGYSVVTTKRDEWLHLLPISFQSFGDYKAPLPIYITGMFVWSLGFDLWVVRAPFVIASLLAIGAMVWLTKELAVSFNVSNTKAQWWSLAAGALLAFSPWHVHFSRVGFESGMALTLVLIGTLAFLKWHKPAQKSWVWGVLAVGFLIASLYTYHSTKVFIPLLGIVLVFFYKKAFFKRKQETLFLSLFGLSLLAPLVFDIVRGSGAERANQTTFLASDVSLFSKGVMLLSNFGSHLDPNFLFLGKTTNFRHGDGAWGVLLSTTFFLSVIAIGWWFKYLKNNQQKNKSLKNWITFSMVWVGAGLIAPSLGLEIPHSNRALIALPGFVWLAIAGFQIVIDWAGSTKLNAQIKGSHQEKNIFVKTIIGTIILVHLLLFLGYSSHYFGVYSRQSADDFKEGYAEAFAYVLPYEYGNNGLKEVDKIIFTSYYGQPYIYALIARGTSPYVYHGGSLIKYEFKEVTIGDLNRNNALVVAAGDDNLPTERADKVIYGSDGSVRFQIFVTE